MSSTKAATDPMISSGEAAALLGVTDMTVRRWAKSGALPAYRFGYKFRFVLSEVEAFKQRGRESARAA